MEMASWLALAIAWAVFASVMACVFFRDAQWNAEELRVTKRYLNEQISKAAELTGELCDCQSKVLQYRDDLNQAQSEMRLMARDMRIKSEKLRMKAGEVQSKLYEEPESE
jgi:hypothetical protein